MRTTIDVPADLLRRAKALAAARGESLKTLFTRAVAAEVGAAPDGSPRSRQRVALPLFGNPDLPKVSLTSDDIARALAETDAELVTFDRACGQRYPPVRVRCLPAPV